MIYLGADHGGYELKEQIKAHLTRRHMAFEDLGAFSREPSDYPDFALAVSRNVAAGRPTARGILACTTATGTCVAANKVPGIRAAIGYDDEAVERARWDLDANVLCLAGGSTGDERAVRLVDLFLDTGFSSAERHVRRIGKIEAAEREYGGGQPADNPGDPD